MNPVFATNTQKGPHAPFQESEHDVFISVKLPNYLIIDITLPCAGVRNNNINKPIIYCFRDVFIVIYAGIYTLPSDRT